MKNTKGITLIALIVTIIVLIILAGISVNLLFGNNGILNKAKDSSMAQEIAEIKEKIGLDITAKQIETKGIVTKSDLETILGGYGTVNYNQDGTIKSITTNEKGYEINLSDIYLEKVKEEVEQKKVVYAQGTKVQIGNEKFYVLTENDSVEATTIELFSMYNLNKTAETTGVFKGHYMQLVNASNINTSCRFSNNGYWSGQYPINLNTYPIPKTDDNAETLSTNALLKADDYAKAVGGNMATGRLLTYEEAYKMKIASNTYLKNMLWGRENKPGTSAYLNYWLGYTESTDAVDIVNGIDGNFGANSYNYENNSGVRPVINVPKSIVEKIETITITYNKNDSSALGILIASGEIILDSNIFTAPNGKIFKEWNTKQDGTGTKYEMGEEVIENITLYAIWKDIPVYTQGQKVKIENEKFYVLTENDSVSNTTIELFAMYNLNKNPETTGKFSGHYIQLPNAIYTDTGCRFSNISYWSNETSYPLNLNTYKIPTTGSNAETLATNALLKADDYAKAVGGRLSTGRLLTYEEAVTIKNENNTDLNDMLWGKENKQGTSDNYYLSIWLGSANNSSSVCRLQASTETLSSAGISTQVPGVRPIITVSKSIVEEID